MDMNTSINSALQAEVNRARIAEQTLGQVLSNEISIRNRADALDGFIYGKTLSPAEKEQVAKKLKEKTAINLIRGELERKYNITFSELTEIYETLLRDNPEKLI